MNPARFKVKEGEKAHLRKRPTRIDPLYRGDDEYGAMLSKLHQELWEHQERLYAVRTYSMLIVFQGMDTAGKDGAIKHVMSGVNPQGCQVASFKTPSSTELDHDFLWRVVPHLPARGQIGIFNRSYYEELLVPRVHPQVLDAERIPRELLKAGKTWERRANDIAHYERYLSRQGVKILKFFLHLSKEEQKRRLLARVNDPKKNWKLSAGDLAERKFWKDYQEAYEDCLTQTSLDEAPWYVVPADDKKNARILISRILNSELADLGLKYPRADAAKLRELKKIKTSLEKKSAS